MSWEEYRNKYRREQERADSWHGFQNKFMQLAREEQGRGRADVITNGKALRRIGVLRAHCDYKDYRERVFVAEEVRTFYESLGVELTSEDLSKIEAKMLEWTELEKKAGLKAPETGRWTYGSGAVSENIRERVRLCVAKAGRALPNYPEGKDPEDFWLHRLYLDLLDNNSDSLFAASQEGGMILSVCVASATFCSRLERQALEQTEPGKLQIPPAQPMERGIAEATGGRPPFDQDENLRNAILKKKARVVEIERTLNRPLATEHRGRNVHGGGNWRLRLEEERQHLLTAVSELEAELGSSTVSGVQNNDKTVPYYIDKLMSCLAVEPADLWPEYGEAAPYVKQLAETVWDKKVQWGMGGDALESHHKREELIQIICHDYPDAAKELGLPLAEAVAKSSANAGESKLADRFGISKDALCEIEDTVYDHLDSKALRIEGAQVWRELKHSSPVASSTLVGLGMQHWLADNVAREAASRLRPLFSEAASEYAEMLTRTIVDHDQQDRPPIHWKAIADRAVEFCVALTSWEKAARWLFGPLKAAGLEWKDISPRTRPAFLAALSAWMLVGPHSQPSLSNEPVAEGVADLLRRKIRHIARLAREKKPTIDGSRPISEMSAALAADPFNHTEDYRSVVVRGETYTLTTGQAQMIEILDEAYKNGTPDISATYIMERRGTPNSRWQDTWKANRGALKALIETGSSKGTLRLKL